MSEPLTKSDYDAWADFYDIIHEGLPGEAEFYVGLAARLGGKALELGAGTGRIAIPMAMTGVDVVGLDNSFPMLQECQAKLEAVGPVKGRLRLVQADMRSFALAESFSCIVMAYRTFMHLLTEADQARCLQSVRAHLAPDGLFALNTWLPDIKRLSHQKLGSSPGDPVLLDRYPIPEEGITLVHSYAAAADLPRQRLSEKHLIQEMDDEDGTVLEEHCLALQRAWSTPEQMYRLAVANGFEVIGLYGDFELNPLTESSTEMIWLLRDKS